MQRLPSLKSIQAFEAAGRTGSFQTAARELNVTPSAVSHQIKSLEIFLGIRLFERRTRKTQLTLVGAAYLETISIAFMQMEVATRRVMERDGIGELKLAVAPAFLDRWLLPRFNDFTDRHPNIEIDIQSSVGVIDFNSSEIDMAVYFGDGQWLDVTSTHLRQSSIVPVCSPLLLETERVMEPADFLKFRLLQVKKRPEEWPNWFELTQTNYHPSQGAISFSSGMNTARAATKGLGIALCDPSLISDELESGELMIPIEFMMRLPKSFYLVSQKNRPLNLAMKTFQEWIIEKMNSEKI